MARLADGYPPRRSDPTLRAKTYIARRVGMNDPTQTDRRLRRLERAPRLNPGAAVQTLPAEPAGPERLEAGRLYRVAGGDGQPDIVRLRLRDQTGALALGRVIAVANPAAVVGSDTASQLASLLAILRAQGVIA